MPRYLAKKRIERAVDDRVAQIYHDIAVANGWLECTQCLGHRQIADSQGKMVRCPNCKGTGHLPESRDED